MGDDTIEATVAQAAAGLRPNDKPSFERAVARLAALGPSAIPALLARMRAERNTTARIGLGDALALIGRPAWEPLLAAATKSDDLDFGWSVAWAIQKFVPVCTADDFLAALRHPNVHVRWATALVLGAFPEPRVVDALIAALCEDGPATVRSPREVRPANYHRKVRLCAAKSLRQLGTLALPALLVALESENPLVRAGAADALTGTSDARALEPLLRAARDSDADVRRNAIQALAALVPALDPEQQRRAGDALVTALYEQDQHAQIAAVKGIGALGAWVIAPVMSIVRETRCDGENEFTRCYAVRALADLMSRESGVSRDEKEHVFALLVATLGDTNSPPILCSGSAEALGKTGDMRAVEPLIEALRHPNPYTRYAVAEALQALGDAGALPALREALQVAQAEGRDEINQDEAHEDLCWVLEEAIASLTAPAES